MPKTNVPKINHELWAFGNFYVYSHYQIMHRSGSRHRGSICTYLSKPICRSVFSHVKPTKKEVNSLKLFFYSLFNLLKRGCLDSVSIKVQWYENQARTISYCLVTQLPPIMCCADGAPIQLHGLSNCPGGWDWEIT